MLQPGKVGYELLIGFRFVKDTAAFRKTVLVSYTVAGQRYRIDLRAGIYACPTTMTEQNCRVDTGKALATI